jgi:crotonyl-CoA carboxylase/reductase
MTIETVPIGTLPELGVVPASMFAQVIRSERTGDPREAFVVEEIDVPVPGPNDVLIAVMAAGVNFNNVWAAKGVPIDVIKVRQKGGDTRDYHVGGSDASGIVWAIGDEVTRVAIGDEVVVHHGVWNDDDPWIVAGKDPMIAPSSRIWGYETNDGSFAQFSLAQEHQIMPKAPRLTWEEAAVPTLVGTTAYRMLHGWAGNTVSEDDVVLVWGGSGGLGGQAIQLATLAGARAVAVVSSAERGQYCVDLGAAGYINRKDFDHWGVPPHWDDNEGQREWTGEARAFGKAMWDILGERRNPNIVFEHPGEDTIPTSIFVCDPGGMVVICAGTTGYTAVVDLRYHWTRQKRLQGSHGTNDEQAYAYNQLVVDGKIDPCLGRVARFEEIGEVHYDMDLGKLPPGNTAVLIGASEPGLGQS